MRLVQAALNHDWKVRLGLEECTKPVNALTFNVGERFLEGKKPCWFRPEITVANHTVPERHIAEHDINNAFQQPIFRDILQVG